MKSSKFLAMCLLFFACTTQTPQPIVVSDTVVESTNVFAFDFLKEMQKEEAKSKNFFVSPLSLNMALGMLLNGTDGNSTKEVLKTLRAENFAIHDLNSFYETLIHGLPKVDPKVTNLLANSIWQEERFPVESAFVNTLKNSFAAEHFKEDFGKPATVDKLNNWAEKNTNGKIDKILDRINQEQVMFLINALYFKGDWSQKFDKKRTFETDFYGLDKTSKVDMMVQRDTFAYASLEKFQFLELPYGNGFYNFGIVLPNEGEQLEEVINSLSTSTWEKLQKEKVVQKVDVQLPKIKMAYEIKLNKVLSNMGMPSLFTGSADLSKISPPAGKIAVGFVKQNSFLEIDEEGTEAAAVTTIGIELTSLPNYPQIICNKPFVFFIYEKSSGTIQFIGRITQL